jgi:hypothetical protein
MAVFWLAVSDLICLRFRNQVKQHKKRDVKNAWKPVASKRRSTTRTGAEEFALSLDVRHTRERIIDVSDIEKRKKNTTLSQKTRQQKNMQNRTVLTTMVSFYFINTVHLMGYLFLNIICRKYSKNNAANTFK